MSRKIRAVHIAYSQQDLDGAYLMCQEYIFSVLSGGTKVACGLSNVGNSIEYCRGLKLYARSLMTSYLIKIG